MARVWPLGSVIVAGTVCLAPAPAAAACDREVDLASAVAHAGQGQVAAAGDKFALARTQCGDAVLGGRDAALDARRARGEPARESRQLSLYPVTAGTPTPAASIAAPPAARGRSRSSSMAASAPSATPPTGELPMRGAGSTTLPSVRGDRFDAPEQAAPQRAPGAMPMRAPSKTTLRVRALADTMSRAATRYRLDPLLLHAIASVESNHHASARSSAGAIGVMQVMPDTARRFGVREPERDLHDPAINIEVGAAYLSDLRTQYENNLKLMLAAYNAGEGAVQRYGNRVPPYAETQNYVKRVIRMYGALHRRTGRQAPVVAL